jgi:hypothetical protein
MARSFIAAKDDLPGTTTGRGRDKPQVRENSVENGDGIVQSSTSAETAAGASQR